MIEYLFLIPILILAGILAYKITRKTAGLVSTLVIIIGMIFLVFGFYAVQDAVRFKEEFSESKSIFVLEEDGDFFTPIAIDFNDSEEGVVNDSELEIKIHEILNHVEQDEYYKVFIIRRELLEAAGDFELDTGMATLEKETVVDALFSEQPRDVLAEAVAEKEGVPENIVMMQVNSVFDTKKSAQEFLFATTLIEVFGNDPILMIRGVKEGNIIITPDSLMFKIVRVMPTSVFESVAKLAGEDDSNARQDEILEG